MERGWKDVPKGFTSTLNFESRSFPAMFSEKQLPTSVTRSSRHMPLELCCTLTSVLKVSVDELLQEAT